MTKASLWALACVAAPLITLLPSVGASRAWSTAPCPEGNTHDEAPSLICEGLTEKQLCSQAAVDLTPSGGKEPCAATIDYAGKINTNASDPCYVPRPLGVGEYPPFDERVLYQDRVTQYAYFDSVQRECKQYKVNDKVGPGCAPFKTLHSCTYHCRDYSNSKLDEVETELEEEGVQIGKFLFHAIIMLYMCFGLALVCEDFFVAALEIIIDKLKLPPDVAGVPQRLSLSGSLKTFPDPCLCRSYLYGSRFFVTGANWCFAAFCAQLRSCTSYGGRNCSWQPWLYFSCLTPGTAVSLQTKPTHM